jgi:hypothetical protein
LLGPCFVKVFFHYNIRNCFEHILPLGCTEVKGDLIRPGFEK